MDLLADSEEEDDQHHELQSHNSKISINRKFAEKYESSKRIQELRRAKDILEEEEDSEDDESEDEDAEALSASLDIKIIKAITSLKTKDPKIYDKSVAWFDNEDSESDVGSDSENEGKKRKTFKDVLREQLLEYGAGEDIETDYNRKSLKQESSRLQTILYDDEQKKLREDFLRITKESEDAGDDDEEDMNEEGSILKLKKKSNEELAKEEEELQRALLELKSIAANTKKSDNKHDKPSHAPHSLAANGASNDSEGGVVDPDAFLVDFMLNKKWRDPEYLTTSTGEGEGGEGYEEEEEELDRVDNFESKYNFRFEELAAQEAAGEEAVWGMGAGQVVGHARVVPGTVRRVDETRKKQRELRKERKEREARQREAELRRLKNLKREEIRARLKRIGEIGGLGIGLTDKDLGTEAGEEEEGEEDILRSGLAAELDEEWDPDRHEAQMRAQFGDDYYQQADDSFVPDADEGGDGEWGWGVDEPIEDTGDGYDYPDTAEVAYDDDAGASNGGKGRKGGVSREERALAEKVEEELYELDYEDVVAGIPCRFKYRQVEPEDFGLDTEDILLADDAELNKFVSLKKLSTYREKSVDKAEREARTLAKKRKRLRALLKEQKLAMQGTESPAEKPVVEEKDEVEPSPPTASAPVEEGANTPAKKKARRKKKAKGQDGKVGWPFLNAGEGSGVVKEQLEPAELVPLKEASADTESRGDNGHETAVTQASKAKRQRRDTPSQKKEATLKDKVKNRLSLYS